MRYFYLLFPIAPLFISLVYTFLGMFQRNNINIIFILLSLSLGLINYTRIPTSDLAGYYSIFEILKDKEYSEFLLFIYIDFIFYFVSMLLVKFFDSVHVTVLFWTFISYFTYFKSLEIINNSFANKNIQILLLIIFFSITLGMLFNHSSHLVRQFVAVSLLIYAITLVTFEKNNKKANIVFILAGFIHFSIFIFAPLFLLKNLNKNIVIILIPIFLFLAFFIGSNNILVLLSNLFIETNYAFVGELIVRVNLYIDTNNGDISLGAFIKTAAFFLFSWILLLKLNKYTFLTYTFLYLCILLVLFRNTDLVLIRYFFYMQFFYGLFLFIALKEFNNKVINMLFYFYVLYGLLVFFKNITSGNWQYITNDFSLLFVNLYSYLTYWK